MHIPNFLNKDDPLIAQMATAVEAYADMYKAHKITHEEYNALCEQEVVVSKVFEQCEDETRRTFLITACSTLLSLALALK